MKWSRQEEDDKSNGMWKVNDSGTASTPQVSEENLTTGETSRKRSGVTTTEVLLEDVLLLYWLHSLNIENPSFWQ